MSGTAIKCDNSSCSNTAGDCTKCKNADKCVSCCGCSAATIIVCSKCRTNHICDDCVKAGHKHGLCSTCASPMCSKCNAGCHACTCASATCCYDDGKTTCGNAICAECLKTDHTYTFCEVHGHTCAQCGFHHCVCGTCGECGNKNCVDWTACVSGLKSYHSRVDGTHFRCHGKSCKRCANLTNASYMNWVVKHATHGKIVLKTARFELGNFTAKSVEDIDNLEGYVYSVTVKDVDNKWTTVHDNAINAIIIAKKDAANMKKVYDILVTGLNNDLKGTLNGVITKTLLSNAKQSFDDAITAASAGAIASYTKDLVDGKTTLDYAAHGELIKFIVNVVVDGVAASNTDSDFVTAASGFSSWINDLKNDVAERVKERNAFETKSKTRKAAVTRLANELKDEKDKVTRLANELKDEKDKVTDLKKELDDEKDKVTNLKKELKAATDDLVAEKTNVTRLAKELDDEKDKVKDLEKDLKAATGAVIGSVDYGAKLANLYSDTRTAPSCKLLLGQIDALETLLLSLGAPTGTKPKAPKTKAPPPPPANYAKEITDLVSANVGVTDGVAACKKRVDGLNISMLDGKARDSWVLCDSNLTAVYDEYNTLVTEYSKVAIIGDSIKGYSELRGWYGKLEYVFSKYKSLVSEAENRFAELCKDTTTRADKAKEAADKAAKEAADKAAAAKAARAKTGGTSGTPKSGGYSGGVSVTSVEYYDTLIPTSSTDVKRKLGILLRWVEEGSFKCISSADITVKYAEFHCYVLGGYLTNNKNTIPAWFASHTMK